MPSSKPRPWKFPRIKTHYFDDRLYKIRWRRPRVSQKEAKEMKRSKTFLYGRINPTPRTMSISMDRKLHPTAMDLFGTLLHESAHASFPQLDEEAIMNFEGSFVSLLKRIKMKMELP